MQSGFAAAFDVFSASRETLVNIRCDDSINQAQVTVGNGSSYQFIYNRAYHHRSGSWQPLTLSPLSGTQGAWLIGRARVNINLNESDLDVEQNLAVWICTWDGSVWHCGCRDQNCASAYWSLQKFTLNSASNCIDSDNDGYGAAGSSGCVRSGIDCDDSAWYRNPGAPETCDGHDNDCDGTVDEGCDDDGDDYCDSGIRFYNHPVAVCPNTNLPNDSFGDDCNDNNGGVNPGAADICGDGNDQDCSGSDAVCVPTPYCGDGSCNGTEDCSGCEIDCGACVSGGGCPSILPAGMLVCEDFEDRQWSDSFDGTFNSDNVSIVTLNNAYSGDYAARMYGGYLGAAFDYNISLVNNDEVYLKYYQYFPTGNWNWSNISLTGLKQVRAGAGQGDGWPIQTFKGTGNGPHTHGYYSEGNDPAGIPDRYFFPGGQFPSLGTWHEVEVYLKYSDTEGGYWWKLDGQVIAGSESFTHDVWPPPFGNTINVLRFAGGNGFPDGDHYYVDNVEIWDRLP